MNDCLSLVPGSNSPALQPNDGFAGLSVKNSISYQWEAPSSYTGFEYFFPYLLGLFLQGFLERLITSSF